MRRSRSTIHFRIPMTTTAAQLASQLDAVPAPTQTTAPDAGFDSNDEQHLALLRELTASWHPVSTVADRRPGHRVPCNFAAELIPLDQRGSHSGRTAMSVQVTDLSKRGIGIMHPHPMPHRLVQLTFTPEPGQLTRLVVRLKWCRFKRADVYQSGRQIVRVLAST